MYYECGGMFTAAYPGGRATVMDQDEFVTVSEAAKALRVSVPTIKRWLKDGRIPAYRLGPRYIRIRRADLTGVLTPMREEVSPMPEGPVRELAPIPTTLTVKPLTAAQIVQLDKAIRGTQKVIEMIRTRRNGEPLAPSWPILRESREDRATRYE